MIGLERLSIEAWRPMPQIAATSKRENTMTPFNTTTRQRLGIIATACLMSVALPAAPAMAQKIKDKGTPPAETSAESTPPEFTVTIATIDAVDSNVDEDTLRAIFSGDILGNAEALADLDATSITVPEIAVGITNTVDGEYVSVSYTLTDLVLSDVTDGVAASLTLGGVEFAAGEMGSGSYGTTTASNFNISGLLGNLGLVEGSSGSTEFQTIYSDLTTDGGTLVYPSADCTIGTMSTGEFKMRPLSYSIPEIMTLVGTLAELEGDETPPPETIVALLRIYADAFTAFESSPITYDGISCDGTDESGEAVSVEIAGLTMESFSPGVYPAISLDGIDFSVADSGSISIGNFTFKGMDISGPIAAIQNVPDDVNEAWFEANARALIPAVHGLSFADVAVDVPDPETEGARIQASVGAFDLTLGEYLNGIPTDILTSGSNIVIDLPETSDDPQLQQLIALGVTSIDAGFTVDASWNEADETISVDEVSVTGANLATVKLAGTIANATKEIFGLDQDVALMASMGVAISQLKLDVTDDGLSDIILASVAAEQGSDAATMRPVFAGLAEGTVVGMLAGAAEAQKVGAALNAFISGKAKYLTIEMTAKEPPGLGMMDFMAAEEDPTVLIGKVTIDASAK
jgi:hypothetical protein